MKKAQAKRYRESLKMARLFMVLSSISPLFILWAIRGNNLVPDSWFIGFCTLIILLPNTFLWFRIRTAKKQSDKREIVVGKADDHRDHILVYLFAILLPFYSVDIDSWREFGSTLIAIAFIVFLFWYLNLHYVNLLFAVRGYRIFTVYPPADDNPLTGKIPFVLITKRVSIVPGELITAYRLSNTVYMEIVA